MANGKFSKPRKRSDETLPFHPPVSEEPAQPSPLEDDFTVSAFFQEEPPVTPSRPEPVPEEQAIEQAFWEMNGAEMPEGEDCDVSLTDKILDFISQNRKMVLVGVCAIVLVLILGIIAFVLLGSSSDPYGGKILNNVTIAGINVGGMTRSEAEKAVGKVTDKTFTEKDMVIELPDTTLRLSPDKTGAKLDVKAAVQAAYDFGRTGSKKQQEADYEASFTGNHIIALLPYLELNEEYIRGELEAYASQFGSTFTQSSYVLEGDMPALEADQFDENAPCQTLVITIGEPGFGLDLNALYNDILDAYSLNQFQVTVDAIEPEATPDPIDLEAIYEEVYIAPIDASVDMQTFDPIPGVYGYGFDMARALKLLDMAQYGDILEIPMEYIEPEVLEDEVLFQDVLGYAETPHNSNADRNTNLKLACQAINGLVLNPGEEFSFNNTLGERTSAKGYKPAPAYSGDKLVDSVGGGICQVSSTLYWSTLLADLEIVNRVCHGMPVTYMDLGLDATVSWGYTDFKFKNNTNFPIKIEARVENGYVKIQILGTDDRDYYVVMESKISSSTAPGYEYEVYGPDEGYTDGQVLREGSTGYYVKSYKCKYDKETNKLLTRDFEANSSYITVNFLIAKVESPETTAPEETEPEQTKPSETQPEETKPSETLPTETTPVETVPVETTSTETVPAETASPPSSPSESEEPAA